MSQAAAFNASMIRWPASGGTALPVMCIVSRWLSGRCVSFGKDCAAIASSAVIMRIRSPSTTAQRSSVVMVPIGRSRLRPVRPDPEP